MKITRRQLQFLIQEEIRQVRPGCFKLYPKKPRKGEKRKKALSKKCKSKSAAQDQEAAIKASQNERRRRKKDPKVGTGRKPPGSGRRLYTDENPKDTVRIKYATPADARKTCSKVKRISKPYARKIQILTVMEQRSRFGKKPQQAGIAKRCKAAIRRLKKK